MSILGKLPFVQKIMGSMNADQLVRLNHLVNNLGEPDFVDFDKISEANIGVNYVRLTFSELYMNSHFGFLIYVDDQHCGFFSFQDFFEEMKSIEIDPVHHKYWYLQEHLTAEEFRRALDDAMEAVVPEGEVTAGMIDSENSTAGQVLTSNGEGGASWADAPAFKTFPSSWPTSSTTAAFCAAIDADDSAVVGMAYLGEATFEDLPEGVSNAEIKVEIMNQTGTGKVIHLICSSGNVEPYHWEYTYWNAGADVSGWVTLGSGGGIEPASGPNKVLVSGAEGVWGEANSVPLADNLLANPENNDSPYSYGPTGGSLDIATGEEAYLQDIKGMSIVWNQLYDGSQFTTKSSHIYVRYKGDTKTFVLINQIADNIPSSGNDKIYDLTLMFGGNDKIPFSMEEKVEYPANGTYVQQSVNGLQRFQRLFANVDLENAPYDAGTIKNVKATKLVETGRNLWNENDTDMVTNGIKLVAGYRYEVYISGSNYRVQISKDNGNTWEAIPIYRYQRADGAYIWVSRANDNQTILMKEYNSSYPIKYVGFVHSGNYCLTSGTLTSSNKANTDVAIPPYVKHEFVIDGIDGLNGIGEVCDTKDMKRIESVDLSTLTWTQDGSVYKASISGIKPETTNILATKYLGSEMSVDNQGVLSITTASSPTGTLLYELATPVATGESAFEPIPLKSGDTYVVDDMGSEYFIQPSGTNCPVNQVSYYYPNLKDKLVNLEEGTKVERISYDYSLQPLEAIKIGIGKYRILPFGSIGSNQSSLAIGYNSDANRSNAISIGYSAICRGNSSTALGHSAYCYGAYCVSIGCDSYCELLNSVAVGYQAKNYLQASVSFDSPNSTNRTYQCYSPEKIFFRNGDVNSTMQSYSSYKSGHYLSEYVQNQTLVLQDGKYYISYTDANNYKTFKTNCVSGTATDISASVTGVHITVELDGTTSHAVVGLDLKPYGTYGYDSYGRVNVDGTVTDIYATMDADGCVLITPPAGSTIVSVTYNLK